MPVYVGSQLVSPSIPRNIGVRNQNLNITSNGVYSADEGFTGIGTAVVNVPTSSASTTDITVTNNKETYLASNYGVDGFSSVTTNLPIYSKSIDVNGTYKASSDGWAGYSQVTVNVPSQSSVLQGLTVTSNGTYTPPLVGDTYIGINWESRKSSYTGSVTPVGDYMWFLADSLDDIKIDDYAYNGQLFNNEIIPNPNESLCQVVGKSMRVNIYLNIITNQSVQAWEEDYEKINGIKYFKINVGYAKQFSSVPITGNYLWVQSDNISDISKNDSIYDSIDSSDSAPDLSNPIDYIKNIDSPFYMFFFDLISGQFPIFYVNTTYTFPGYDGFNRVEVNVPSSGSAVLESINITENGIYTPPLVGDTYKGLNWSFAQSSYSGPITIVGDYMWFKTNDITTLSIGDYAYNGKLDNNNVIPNGSEPLGQVTSSSPYLVVGLNIYSGGSNPEIYTGNFVTYDNVNYYKFYIGDWRKPDVSVNITGEFVWVQADSLSDISVNDVIYNSTDSSDSAPDLSESIGYISSLQNRVQYQFDFISGWAFSADSSSYYPSYTSDAPDGYNRVEVNVPNPSTGTLNITSNNTYNVTDYATAVVNVPSSSSKRFGMSIDNFVGAVNNGVYQTPNKIINESISFDGVTDVSFYSMNRLLAQYTVSSITFPDLVTLTGDYALINFCASSTANVYLPNLESITGSNALYLAFEYLNGTISMPNLESITGSNALNATFGGYKQSSFEFTKLKILTGQKALYNCFNWSDYLTSLSFPALQSDSFGTYTDQFSDMLRGVNGCTVHFPSNLQSVIGSWTDVQNGFGGTNTVVLFDLPATE